LWAQALARKPATSKSHIVFWYNKHNNQFIQASFMQRKHICLAVTLASFVGLSGCANMQANKPSTNTTPVPQALIEAAQQASQARMVYADLQARLHGHSVESVRLDGADAGVPDFMKARVRLDYNGPMMQVLERVANDIGYRVNEYGKPTAGIGWSPWLRVGGDKQLIDHVREMNTQVPWHVVLDHRNRRLVIDYSSDGGMAEQIRSARDADDRRREESSINMSPSLPSTQALTTRGSNATQDTLTNQPAYPVGEGVSQQSYREPQMDEQWYVAIEGYVNNHEAQAMVEWLSEDRLSATIVPVGNTYHVRIAANGNADAKDIQTHLNGFDVPNSIGMEKVRRQQSVTATPATFPRNEVGQSAQPMQSQERNWSRPSGQSSETNYANQTNKAVAQSAILTDSENRTFEGHWRVQVAYGSSLESFGRHIKALSDNGHNAHLVPASSQGSYHMRVGPFDDQQSMSATLAAVKRLGFNDAYALAPNQ
jgi:hypothetical protein